jgi:NADH-quinone oxidoreductase subunit N
MSITAHDILITAPFTIVSITALLVVTLESLLSRSERATFWCSTLGLLAALLVALLDLENGDTAYMGMMTSGGYANYLAGVFCFAGLLSLMLSRAYIKRETFDHGEFYSLLLLAVAGMILMAAAADLIVFFLGLELMSISFYVLAGFALKRVTSNEAALKYFLLGAFATGFLLYGIALIYGATGSTSIPTMIQMAASNTPSMIFLIGMGLLVIGLGFKIAAVPFHMWVPDVYEGSPTPVSGFMSTGGKAAAFAAMLLIFAPTLVSALEPVRELLAVLSVVSMIVGNIFAISQSSIKRMLAYSSIAHAGYLLVGVVAANSYGANGILFYLVAYTAMNIGAFGIVSFMERTGGQNLTFDDMSGLSSRQPVVAGAMALFMFSLTGIPPFAGFFGKYYVFAGAVTAGYTWLAIVGVVMSLVSAYYYLRLVVLMYFREQVGDAALRSSPAGMAAVLVSALVLIVCGLFPSLLLNLSRHIF